MSNTNPSTNMALPVPAVGVDPGPQWASDLNSCLTIIDGHNHAPGSGVQITPAGLNVNIDLPLNNNNLITARSLRMQSQLTPLALASDLGCLYESGVDLYYNDGNGTQIRLTQSGGIAGSPGSISNLTSPASATYVSGSATFVWQSDVNTPANMDAASYILRNLSANSKGLTLNPPAAMGSNYSITLPTLPGATSFLSIDSSGNMAATIATNGGITATNLAADSVITSKILDANVTTPKIADLNVTTAKIANGAVTATKLEALNAQASGSSGAFTTSSATPVLITNQTLAYTATARQFIVSLMPDTTGIDSFIFLSSSPANFTGYIIIKRDTNVVAKIFLQCSATSASMAIPPNIQIFETPGAGTYTYTALAQVLTGNSIQVSQVRLVIYEL